MWQRSLRGLLVAAALLAAVQPTQAQAASDPFEAVNRYVHWFNGTVQSQLLGPLAEVYLAATSADVRRGVVNAFANLSEPVTAVSGLAAGNVGLAANAAARFGINSTLGLAGVRDRATEMGYPRRPFGMADALCSWSVPSGPFLVLPLLGPSTLRDAGALAATSVALSQTLGADTTLAWGSGDAFVGYAELHREIKRIDAESLDAYAVYRSAYLQRRAAMCPVDRIADAMEASGDEP